MPLPIPPDTVGLLVAFVIVCLVLGCMRIIGVTYDNEVRRHDLRVRVHQLREEQKRRQAAIEAASQGLPAPPAVATPPAKKRQPIPEEADESTTGDASAAAEAVELPLRRAA